MPNWRKSIKCFILISIVFVSLIYDIHAESKYSLKNMTPEITAALESRKKRFDRIRDLKDKGVIGENNKGYVEILEKNIYAEELTIAENSNRRFIYKTIMEQNDLHGAMGQIEKVFAQVQRDKAKPGDRIQTERGEWVKK